MDRQSPIGFGGCGASVYCDTPECSVAASEWVEEASEWVEEASEWMEEASERMDIGTRDLYGLYA